jgi:fructose-specific phosphotransferase system IIA component
MHNITEIISTLVLQMGVVFFAVRIAGIVVKRLGIPSVLGELIVGIIIGPYALGGVGLPGFPDGLFAVIDTAGGLAVSPELYAFSTVGSIILLFATGLETNLGLFLRYSLAGGVIGIGGVAVSFLTGALAGNLLLGIPFTDPSCLFLGVLSTATSVGITARTLSDQKKMDSAEGVTILAAAVFDDVLGIIILAVVLGLVSILAEGGSLNTFSIVIIAARAFGIWLGFTVLGLIFSKKIAGFLKIFKSSYDFSILALGISFLLAGIFEKQGMAMIIGSYVAGLSLSKTDIAAVIQERIHGLYEFFVPIFFAVMGMMVNVHEIFSREVLVFGIIYSATAILSKVIGCGGPAMFLGFNVKGALRIGAGMVPRGEVALIIAGIGMASGVLDNFLFSAIILMTLITTLFAPPLLSMALKLPGIGTRKLGKENDTVSAVWEFYSDEIADVVIDTLLKDLKAEGFYVQMLNIDDGLSQARKGDIALSITESESTVTIETSKVNMPFVKTAMYEAIIDLHSAILKLENSSSAEALKKELAEMEGSFSSALFSMIQKNCICMDLQGETKEEVIEELLQMLAYKGKLQDFHLVMHDVLQRETIMSTGMEHGIAIPHAKTEGVTETTAAIGIKKSGVDFGSVDGEKTHLIILTISPTKNHFHHIQFLSAIISVLNEKTIRESVINAQSEDELVKLLQAHKPKGNAD